MAVLDDGKILRPGTVGASGGRDARRKDPLRRTQRGTGRGFFHGTVLLILAAMVGNASGGHAQGISEYEVKAAFLYNFAKFVEWPDPASGSIRLCIVGDDPFGNILEETVRGKTISEQPIEIKRLNRGDNPRSCQIAFISVSERPPRAVLDLLQGASTLTVGESPNFAKDGGMINFVLEDKRVHFEINLAAAQRGRLKISSKLLNLARIVGN